MALAPVQNSGSEIDQLLEAAPVSSLQIRVAVICGLVAMLDGFDTQAVAFVAPILAKDWGILPDYMGLIFAAGLAGIMVGQLTLGPLADRFGRKPVILWCTVAFGLGSLATLLAETPTQLLALRFVTGIGLGGATPNIIALTAEYSPPRLRGTIITLMFAGFPLGAAIGGAVSSLMIPQFGWHSVFLLGGLVPLALAPVIAIGLRESPHFMQQHFKDTTRLNATLNEITGSSDSFQAVPATPRSDQQSKGYSGLFSENRGAMTSLLWIAYFCSLLMIYFLMNWLPTVAKSTGLSLNSAIYSAVFLNLGGAIGGIVLGRLSDSYGAFRILAVGYALAGLCLLGVGVFIGMPTAFMVLLFCAGLFTIGGQTALNAAASSLYPAQLRATGLGAALAVGRIGSIAGPAVGGLLIAAQMPVSALFFIVAVPALLSASVMVAIPRTTKR
jgi:MFS transporter, AAHS family, 4-hydroxybenzoate transporter